MFVSKYHRQTKNPVAVARSGIKNREDVIIKKECREEND